MPEGQMPISDEKITLGQMTRNAGYASTPTLTQKRQLTSRKIAFFIYLLVLK
jgi:hypothetical protein